jgi:hypothetical protein
MRDNMTTIIKWNNWRNASIEKTNIIDDVQPGIYFFSANAWGLKGKLPGGKHSWAAVYNGSWATYEVTDLETIEVQGATASVYGHQVYNKRQVIISNRDPRTMWFGNKPTLIEYSKNVQGLYTRLFADPYPEEDVKLYKNNCNTYLSYLLWATGIDKKLNYVGFKNYEYWEKYYV